MKRYILIGFFTFLAGAGFSQGIDGLKYCGTTEAMEKLFKENPLMKADFDAQNEALRQQDAAAYRQGYPRTTSTNYVIPVVFHIIHDYGSENIPDAQIYSEMRILNEDYNKLNADTAAVDAIFKPLIANVGITFKLAQKDPNGNCTNGIDRIHSLLTYNAGDNAKLNPWPRANYLNVWVVSSIANGAAGYAYLPSSFLNPAIDGVIILSNYIGDIGTSQPLTSRALSHEIGHCLNMEHPWGNTNAPGVACGDDLVTDTPITEGWDHCPSSPSAAMICNAGVEENYQNFMDYSYCSHMFTNGQANRMLSALTSTTAQRSTLWSNANLTATGVNGVVVPCKPIADFEPIIPVMLCAGGTANFQYVRENGQPASWSWSFPGGTPSSSTDSVPAIVYNTPGTYSVSLTETNSGGSNTTTRASFVIVSPTTAQYSSNAYTESFENATTVTNDWIMVCAEGNPWARTTIASATGTASLRLHNSINLKGEQSAAISPSFDAIHIPNGTVTFKLAAALKASTNTDRLLVYFSPDCGQTWIARYNKSGATLATAPVNTGSFVPTAAQWRTETISLGPLQAYADVRAKFLVQTDGGNDIFIDDLNIASAFSGIQEEVAGVSNVLLYPNPTDGNASIEFSLSEPRHVQIGVRDVIGREVLFIADEQLNSGEHKFGFSAQNALKPGMYFVTLLVDNKPVSQKLIVR